MAEYQRVITNTELEEILNSAVDLTENRSTYVTNIRFGVSNTEVTLDLFYVAPNPKNPNGEPIAYRVHRSILPLALAKNIGELLVKAMANWEDTIGVKLPFIPQDVLQELENDNDDNT